MFVGPAGEMSTLCVREDAETRPLDGWQHKIHSAEGDVTPPEGTEKKKKRKKKKKVQI
jgi:hypothetical protein